ncbi:hypothetical protein M5K25_028009 [Dendrobium thyrsiflorum]|uniref:PSII 6.1 kDa protein n=1 Tax=Dendrobium thyrsiflorum TaxID=117978 RepID=A0ABD0TVI0_DENTH
MAAVTAAVAAPIVTRSVVRRKVSAAAFTSPIIGLPQIRTREGAIRCSSEGKSTTNKKINKSVVAMVATSMIGATGPALALVDERMSTEGTGLSLGVSNNLLGWILLGVFGLIWALFFIYTSTLEEDEESGLSL